MTNPTGLCMCGCGEPTPSASVTMRSRGWVKGEPLRYRRGHNQRGRFMPLDRYVVENRGYETACHVWQGAVNSKGYAQARRKLVHRLVYEEAHGPIPAGLVIDHLCCVPGCVNPDHLEAVTNGENIARSYRRKRDVAVKRDAA